MIGMPNSPCRSQEDLFSTFETGVAAGCNFFDTAEVSISE